MPKNQQGSLSNFPNPRAHEVLSADGKVVRVVEYEEHVRWRKRVNLDVTALQNPGTPEQANGTVHQTIATTQIQPSQNGHLFTNTGATGEVDFVLPPAVQGAGPFDFFVDAAQTLKVIASGGAKIQNGASTSAANGNIANATSGSTVAVKCIATNRWVCFAVNGTWTVT